MTDDENSLDAFKILLEVSPDDIIVGVVCDALVELEKRGELTGVVLLNVIRATSMCSSGKDTREFLVRVNDFLRREVQSASEKN